MINDIQLSIIYESKCVKYNNIEMDVFHFDDIIFENVDIYNNEFSHLSRKYVDSTTKFCFYDDISQKTIILF